MNQTKAAIEDYDQWTINYLQGVGVQEGLLERVTRLAQEVADLKAERAEVAPAVHEAYVDAQRAVAAITWGNSNNVSYQRGREAMQEDAVRAIRKAAEAHRTAGALASLKKIQGGVS